MVVLKVAEIKAEKGRCKMDGKLYNMADGRDKIIEAAL
jgi:hypothetical protein